MFETREIFRNFSLWMEVIFYLVAFASIGVFLYGFWRRYQKYRRGRPVERFNQLGRRFIKALGIMAKNSTVFKRDPYAGAAHWMIFWGFVVLFIGTCIVALDHDFLEPVFQYRLLKGTFYRWYSVFLDAAGVLFIAGLLMMIFRRGAMKLPQLDYKRVDRGAGAYDRKGYALDDKIFLWLLLLVAISGFFIEGFRIAVDRQTADLSFEKWSPAGWALAGLSDALGLTASGNALHLSLWWLHGIMVVCFVAYIPFSKAMHMLADYANLMFKDEMAARRLPGVTEEQMKTGMGYRKIEDFTWKELLDFDACTKCGRCHVACPARASGAPLSPRDLILDLRSYADSTIGVKELFTQNLSNGPKSAGKEILVAGDVIRQDTLWSCTTCMACVEACPVGIEHLTSIVQLRRTLVDKGKMEDSLQDVLANIGDYGNSFGQPERARAKWTQGLDFQIKDVRKEQAEFLWFVGDFASFDARMQEMTRKVARIFQHIGLDFGLMYEGEKNAGNDVRRIGEEGLFEMLVEDNLAAMSKAKFRQIVTTDPHSFNTLKNEYPEFGSTYPVFHYTGLLCKLLDQGKLTFSKKLSHYKVTYHDPCYLGRYNGETEAPRKLLRALGVEFHEMKRCGANSFCCGAGGGRIWMDDSKLEKRPSEQRIEEALEIEGVNLFIVACPKDYAMYSDAVKTSGNEGKIAVKDIIELVQEAL
ncbi:MAG: (Fe-S)-binding protein [Saprospirales bacterium]|jgi:Fe-S oxidoreductase/nitrate reductase gamma subunit|nr:(Fe-S)-binding protein [Saprospirales bacterium]